MLAIGARAMIDRQKLCNDAELVTFDTRMTNIYIILSRPKSLSGSSIGPVELLAMRALE
jgi:hypothetical protein